MAKTITITDGTSPISLLNTSGLYVTQNGYIPTGARNRSVWRQSSFSEGRALISQVPENVTEPFQVLLNASSNDNAASQLQTLTKLVKKAQQYHTTNWQKTPVYLQVQMTSETAARYALIYDAQIDFGHSVYDIPFDSDNILLGITITIEREPYWRSHAPGSVPTAVALTAPDKPTPQSSATEQFVANMRSNVDLTHVYNYDDSATAFSGNFVAETGTHELWRVAGSFPAADDCTYYGADSPFHLLVLNIGFACGTVNTAAVEFEYWTGAAWAACMTLDFSFADLFDSVALQTLPFLGASDWATTAINGATKYWVRLRLTDATMEFTPAVMGQITYAVNDCYIEIPSTSIDGDMSALPIIRLTGYEKDEAVISHAYFGAKSRGLTYFTSRLNAVDGHNPGSWTVTMGTDTSETADSRAGADGNVAVCTFATQTSIAWSRVTFANDTIAEIEDWEGEYHVYAIVEQNSGTAGDVSIKVTEQYQNGVYSSDVVYTGQVDSGPEILSMGRFSVLPARIIGTETAHDGGTYGLAFHVYAGSSNGATPDVTIFGLCFIPIDEWAGSAVTDQDVMLIAAARYCTIEIDSGIKRKGTAVSYTRRGDTEVIGWWETRGKLPLIEPSTQTRIYWLFTDEGIAHSSLGGSVAILPHERWQFLRGAD